MLPQKSLHAIACGCAQRRGTTACAARQSASSSEVPRAALSSSSPSMATVANMPVSRVPRRRLGTSVESRSLDDEGCRHITPPRLPPSLLPRHTRLQARQSEGFFTPSLIRSPDDASASHSEPAALADSSPSERYSAMDGGGMPPKHDSHYVSDHEYSVRVGRAFDLLRATIPEFMRTGLVDYEDVGKSSSGSGHSILDVLAFRSLWARAVAEEEEHKRQGQFAGLARAGRGGEEASREDPSRSHDAQVYHRRIHFRFCAGGQSLENEAGGTNTRGNLSESEAASLSFSGRNLYFASSHILRHTLNILFSHPRVELERIRLEKRGRRGGSVAHEGKRREPSMSDESPSPIALGGHNGLRDGQDNGRDGDAIHLRVRFTGNLRVTGVEHQYTLVFRYDIDGETGRIGQHTVERIEPAIGRKLWAGITTVWERITGQSRLHPMPTPLPTHFAAPQPSAFAERRRLSRMYKGIADTLPAGEGIARRI